MPVRAVIFDVDGVLVRSMERHYDSYKAALAPVGIDVRREEVYENEGRRSREVIESILQARGVPLPPERLDELSRAKQATFAGFGPMPFYPGVPELVERLKHAGLLVAAVSGTARVNIENHFGDLVRRFDAIVSADDVKRTKPDPEPYLSGLAKLRVPAADAIVVENATLGIRSAKAAGLRVIGVASTLPPEKLKADGADRVVARVADVWPVLEGMR